MKKILILLALLPFLSGCVPCCKNISAHLFLKYQNINGDDLLDPRTPNALKAEDIEVYVLRNGVRVRLFDARMDAPANFKIYGSSTEKYHMMFYFDIAEESFANKRITMFLTYKDGSEDKLIGEFNNDDGPSITLRAVWINNIAIGLPFSPSIAFIIKK